MRGWCGESRAGTGRTNAVHIHSICVRAALRGLPPNILLFHDTPSPASLSPHTQQGYPVAEKQLALPLDGFKLEAAPAGGAGAGTLAIEDAADRLVVSGPDGLTVEVSKANGAVSGWSVGGSQLLAEPVLPCFYRAPTDNDRGGSGGNSFVSR